LRYPSRYTHRIAISNRRLLAADEKGITFKYKDYRIEGPARYKTMTLATNEFIRRFMIHVLPKSFHRIRHYGLLANGSRAANIAHAHDLLAVPARPKEPATADGARGWCRHPGIRKPAHNRTRAPQHTSAPPLPPARESDVASPEREAESAGLLPDSSNGSFHRLGNCRRRCLLT
jgi:hypothetical protein